MIISIVLLSISFVIASISDIKTKMIPDKVHILIIVAGVINISTNKLSLSSALLGLGAVTLVCFLFFKTNNAFGGGDYKMLMSLGFAFGLEGAMFGQVITFALFLLCCLFLAIIKKYNPTEKVQLAPFISVGFVITLIMNGGFP